MEDDTYSGDEWQDMNLMYGDEPRATGAGVVMPSMRRLREHG